MFVIGMDPHKGSHTATVLDVDERSAASCECAPTATSAGGSCRGAEPSPRAR
jgi:hypothetical protein